MTKRRQQAIPHGPSHDFLGDQPTRVAGVTVTSNEIIIRIRLVDADALTASASPVITTRNCGTVGITARQFRDLVRSGVIRGGRLPGSKAVVATLADVIAAVHRSGEQGGAHADRAPAVIDDPDALLDAAGIPRPPRRPSTPPRNGG